MNTSTKSNLKLRQQVKDLEAQVAKLNDQLLDYNDSPSILEDEILVRLYQAITVVSDDKSSSHSEMCSEILSKTPVQIVEAIKFKYQQQGIQTAIDLCRSKSEQATDLGSYLTALTADSLVESLTKLKSNLQSLD